MPPPILALPPPGGIGDLVEVACTIVDVHHMNFRLCLFQERGYSHIGLAVTPAAHIVDFRQRKFQQLEIVLIHADGHSRIIQVDGEP